jgi:hypothetical protein
MICFTRFSVSDRRISPGSAFFSAASAGALGLCLSGQANAAQVFSGAGNANATAQIQAFRDSIGGAKNTDPAPHADGRREITWDGVKLDGTDANPNTQVIDNGKTVAIPINRFQNVGALFEEVYSVSGDGFSSVNPASAGQFPAFSPNNTFVMFDFDPNAFDDRLIQQSFIVPSDPTTTPVPQATKAFGAIFVGVEDPTSSSIEYFGLDQNGSRVSLGKFFVPAGPAGEAEFLGVNFGSPVVTDVELTVGTNALFNFDGTTVHSFGAQNLTAGVDLAVTDDFVFAEPANAAPPIPLPPAALLAIPGVVPAILAGKRRALH